MPLFLLQRYKKTGIRQNLFSEHPVSFSESRFLSTVFLILFCYTPLPYF